jgi:ribonuclease D
MLTIAAQPFSVRIIRHYTSRIVSGSPIDRMVDRAPEVDNGGDSSKSEEDDKARWPLAYKLQLPDQQHGQQSLQAFGFDSTRPLKKRWWSHRLYKGPNDKPVRILYSKTKADSETIAQQFLEEPVIGFDMEWPWNDYKKADLQNKIGLIQVCNEDKIALFHIGLHAGKTTDEIIAPSLRKLIESSNIGKLGVGVLSADFARLRRFFHLNPKGAVELSHLYRLVKFGSHKPEFVSTKLVSLARLVEDQLGHPLYKGDVRTSNWSKPLSRDQINYAAGDAYAGYMLYHCMNHKRLQMKPVPPLPIHAEKYLAYKLSGIIPLRLDGQSEDGALLTSETFFGVPMGDSVASSKSKTKTVKPKAATIPKELTDATSQALYNELVLRRSSLAEKAGLPAYRVTTNTVLVALALQRPTDKEQLLAIKGIGAKQEESYGSAWVEVISQFLSPTGIPPDTAATPISIASKSLPLPTVEPPSTPNRTPRRNRYRGEDSSDSSSAFGSPIQRTPQLHTGLSFTMAETNLDAEASDSDDSLPSLDFHTAPTHQPPPLKRKRTESPIREATQSASQRLQQLTEAPTIPITPTKPTQTQTPAQPLTPHSKLTRNKLVAFSKLVARKMASRPADAPLIVSERTLSLIVIRGPRTMEELERIPGIDRLLLACEQTGTDLLKNVLRFYGK